MTESLECRLAADGLQSAYAACIDEDRLEEWPDFFTADCRYRITHDADFKAGRRHGLIYATSRDMLRDRIRSLREANVFEAQRYRHIVNPANLIETAPDRIAATTGFMVLRVMHNGDTSIFMSGDYYDVIVRQDGGWRFAEKIVVADSRAVDTLLVIPI